MLTSSAKYGVKDGYKAALGVFLGDATLIFLAFLGVASLVKTSPLFFNIVRYAGAAYLLYLGATILYATLTKRRSGEKAAAIALVKTNCFRKAVLLSVTNPKMIIFYVSFFVQFVDPAYPGTAMPFLFWALF